MKFNDLERRFFKRLLDIELDVPVQATLKFEDDVFGVIIVPEITENGYFQLHYYGAPSYVPETQVNEYGTGIKSWSLREAFGSHPSLERAWLNGDPVAVQMDPPQLPIDPRVPPELRTRVRYSGTGHSGTLGLLNGQVVLQNSPLQKAEFCVMGFPDFIATSSPLRAMSVLTPEDRQFLKSIETRLGDDARIHISPTPAQITLDSGDGWNITLTKDDQTTRDTISHTGLITRHDAEHFSADALDNVLECLKYFFAFVAGSYRHPTVVIGYDADGQPVWGEVGPFVSSHNRFNNWFNNDSIAPTGALLEQIFPNFWSKWLQYQDEMGALIQCYGNSNAMRKVGVPQDAIAKSFSGLEILASLQLSKTIGRDPAEDIHKVLSDHKIPNLKLKQDKTPVMARLSENLNEPGMRGVHLLCSVRNYVTHPLDRKRPAKIKKLFRNHLDSIPTNYLYLHDLSQFYLEYSLLKFLGCNVGGSYRGLLEALRQD